MTPSEFFALLGAALSLDRPALAAAAEAGALSAGLAIALLGSVSLMLGQSVVLFANQVSRRRFLACLLVAGSVYVLGLIVWAATIKLVASFVFALDASDRVIVLAVCLGQAPRVFAFLILLPYVGASIQRALDAYALVVVVAALSAMLAVDIWPALRLALAGWALQAGLDELLHRPLAGMRTWLWRASTGRPTPIRSHEVADALAAYARLQQISEERTSTG
jgi:hypothetical protein